MDVKYHYRDTGKALVEDQLDAVLISIFTTLNDVKLAREEREERRRQEEEERKKQEVLRERYNEEVDRTNALINMANDYSTACRIRSLLDALKQNLPQCEENDEYIKWAAEKADWFDPTVAARDPYFGKRQHGADNGTKLEKKRYW